MAKPSLTGRCSSPPRRAGIHGLAARDVAAHALRQELERRATSDTMTGVSNRAHINLLAQNEFARARRYGEPCSCLMIEIDDHPGLAAAWGARAADTVAQVLTGYCVVVMRHCDSFGRLSPARFLALLPETTGDGAGSSPAACAATPRRSISPSTARR